MSYATRIARQYSYGRPGSAVVDLRDFLDRRHGIGNWTRRTGVSTGTDIGPALADACDHIRANHGRGKVIIPAGVGWRLATPVPANKASGIIFEGEADIFAAQIVYDADSGSAFEFSGAGGYTGGGVRCMSILLEDGYPTSTATAIRIDGDATYQPDNMVLEHLYITAIGSSYWGTVITAFGNERTSPQGIRVLNVHDVQCFRARLSGIVLSNVLQANFSNVGTYAGTGNGNDIFITGGGVMNQTNSQQIYVQNLLCSGNITVANCNDINGDLKTVNFSTNSTWTYGKIRARVSGSVFGTPGTGAALEFF